MLLILGCGSIKRGENGESREKRQRLGAVRRPSNPVLIKIELVINVVQNHRNG